MTFKTRLIGLFRLVRLELPVSAGVCVILGELLALGKLPIATELALGFLSVFFISATSLVLNDYFDIESDKINAPHRALPSGQVTERDVVIFSIFLTVLGFITAYLISFGSLVTVIIVWAVGFLYNWRFKKAGLLGNLMVSFSVGMTFIYGGIVVGRPFEQIVWFFGILAMLIDLGEEIAADALDAEGDSLAGSQSLALKFGREKALKASAFIFLAVVVISFMPFVFGWLAWIYLMPLLFMDVVILYSTAKLLNPKTENPRTYIRWIYLSGSLSMLVFIIIRMVN